MGPDSGPEFDGLGSWQILLVVVTVALFFLILARHFAEMWSG